MVSRLAVVILIPFVVLFLSMADLKLCHLDQGASFHRVPVYSEREQLLACRIEQSKVAAATRLLGLIVVSFENK